MTRLTAAKNYLAARNLSPQSLKDRDCRCSRCVAHHHAEQLQRVKRAVESLPRIEHHAQRA